MKISKHTNMFRNIPCSPSL
uniref:Uncharacterized protein n=1 Tax=Arundo donax TaxID=35708 RepID=A0A0A8YYA4_ARUDO